MVSLKGFETLTTNWEFSKTYKEAIRWHSKGIVVFYKEGLIKKVGFTASKKVGNAVKRNFAKRRMRALFFEFAENLNDGIYVFVAKDQVCQMPYEELKKDLNWSFKRLNCFQS